jgi:hypothetical protein
MKNADTKPRWYFVDEAGDPAFYTDGKKIIVGDEGCSRTFSVGFLWTLNPQSIRDALTALRNAIATDRYLKDIPSIKKTLISFHAKDDCPEVRKLVFETLSNLDFGVNVVVARKHEFMFREQFDQSQDKYYDFLVSTLFYQHLHLSARNTIVFARRTNKSRQHSLRMAVDSAAQKFARKWKNVSETEVVVEDKYPSEDSALQAADYVLWAVQRAYEKREMRFFNFMRDKIHFLWDIFDLQKRKKKGEKVFYDRTRNPFDIEKTSPLS